MNPTDLLVMMTLGTTFGICLSYTLRALRPRPPALADVGQRLDRPGLSLTAARALAEQDRAARWRARLSTFGVRVVEATGLVDLATLHRDLRVAGRTLDEHAYLKVAAAIAGAATPLATVTTLTMTGVNVAAPVWVIAAPVGAVVGFMWPDLRLRETVSVRRTEFRHAFGSYLDLVSILVSGGAGITTSLVAGTNAGDGWAYDELRSALRRAHFNNTGPWDALAELGAELDVIELGELAATVRLAGGEGARVTASVTAKAESLRARLRSEVETAAEAQTERMIVPGALLVVGLMMLVVYAVTTQTTQPAHTGTNPTQSGLTETVPIGTGNP